MYAISLLYLFCLPVSSDRLSNFRLQPLGLNSKWGAVSTGVSHEHSIQESHVTLNASGELTKAWRSAAERMVVNVSQTQLPKMYSTEEQQCEILQQFSDKPSLCSKDNNKIPEQKLKSYLFHFKKVWYDFKASFPVGQTCCMGINHQFAIWTTVKELQPLAIIESGVAAGRGTWLLRYAAGPTVPIFSIDIGDPERDYPARSWKDKSGRTVYFTASHFQDLSMIRWDQYIPDPAMRARTLIILDDHQSSIVRLKMLRNWGFRYVFYEDNYPFKIATSADKFTCIGYFPNMKRTFTKDLFGDAYSPNTVCTEVPPQTTTVLEKDKFGKICKLLNLQEHGQNVKWFQEHFQSYFEFPPIFSRCTGLARRPLLLNNTEMLKQFGFPTPEKELWQYGHLNPALIILKPLSLTHSQANVKGTSSASEMEESLKLAISSSEDRKAKWKMGIWW